MTEGMKSSEGVATLVTTLLALFSGKLGLNPADVAEGLSHAEGMLSGGNLTVAAIAVGAYAISRGISKIKG